MFILVNEVLGDGEDLLGLQTCRYTHAKLNCIKYTACDVFCRPCVCSANISGVFNSAFTHMFILTFRTFTNAFTNTSC